MATGLDYIQFVAKQVEDSGAARYCFHSET